EKAREPREQPLLCVQAIDLLVLSTEIEDGKSGIDGSDSRADRWEDSSRIRRRDSQCETRDAAGLLWRGKVKGWRRWSAKVGVLRIAGDADDVGGEAPGRSEGVHEPPANWILPSEVFLHQRVIDDRDGWRRRIIPIGEAAAERDRQLHRRKKIR